MAAVTIPDPLADIVAILAGDSAVDTLTSGSVFGGDLPEAESKLMPRAAVVVTLVGGPGRPGTTKIRRIRFDTICYGSNLNESWKVGAACREALETITTRSGSLISIVAATDLQNARDPVKQWPVCFASYRAITAIAV